MNEFEQDLSRQPLRQVPAAWRKEILSATKSASRPTLNASFLSTLNHQLSTLFWPHPRVWAGLAAIWAFIFVLNFSMRDTTPVIVEKNSPASPEVIAELRQQKLLFAQLIGSSDAREAEPPKLFPRPRTQRAEIFTA